MFRLLKNNIRKKFNNANLNIIYCKKNQDNINRLYNRINKLTDINKKR